MKIKVIVSLIVENPTTDIKEVCKDIKVLEMIENSRKHTINGSKVSVFKVEKIEDLSTNVG